jgi:cbb3-type cytochrome oxidase maturation protein
VDILYLLIPLSAVLILAIVAIFGWAVYSGQFDDVEQEGQRLLQEQDEPEQVDRSQASVRDGQQQFRR